jgi:hypothetical protein
LRHPFVEVLWRCAASSALRSAHCVEYFVGRTP